MVMVKSLFWMFQNGSVIEHRVQGFKFFSEKFLNEAAVMLLSLSNRPDKLECTPYCKFCNQCRVLCKTVRVT
jgi:hypothetical protein